MRDPALHIRRSHLREILSGYGITHIDVDNIMREGLKHSIRNRVFIQTKAKQAKQMKRVAAVDTDYMDKFITVYMALMMENNIKTAAVKKTDPMYTTFKEVYQQAKDFCDLYELSYESGFSVYINLGLSVLGKRKYSLYRMKGSFQRLVDHYNQVKVINDDISPEKTVKLYQVWQQLIAKHFGVEIDFISDASKMVHFVYMKEDIEQEKASYSDWIEAQFEKWSYLNIIPEPGVMYGDNAILAYKKYMGKRHVTYKSDEEEGYFNKVGTEKVIPIKAAKQEEAIRKARLQRVVHGAGSPDDGGSGID